MNRREVALLAVAACVAWAVQGALFHGVRLDDAYITFRYGQNLARGAGLVFNAGDRVLGTTTPGGALLAALLCRVLGQAALPGAMAVAGCAGWAAQAALVYAMVRAPLGRAAAVIASLGVAVGAAHSHLFVPLETNLVAALGLAAILLADRGKAWGAGLALGFAMLMRPDAVLLAAPLGLLAGRATTRRRALGGAALAAVPPLVWECFAAVYYGAWLPHTLGAKAFHDSLGDYASHVFFDLPALGLPFPTPAILAVVAWCAAAWGTRVAFVKGARGVVALAAWGVLHAAVYLVLRPGVGFTWHLYPAGLAFAVAVLVAASEALLRLRAWFAAPLAAGVVALSALAAVKFAETNAHVFWYGSRDAVYREAAAWLRGRAAPGDAVEAEEVGTLAYFSDLRFYDHAGLIGPPFDHGRLRDGTAPDVRFSVMTQPAEVEAHRPFFAHAPPMTEFAYDRWHLWIADLKQAP